MQSKCNMLSLKKLNYLKYIQVSSSALKMGSLFDLKQHRFADIQDKSVCWLLYLVRTRLFRDIYFYNYLLVYCTSVVLSCLIFVAPFLTSIAISLRVPRATDGCLCICVNLMKRNKIIHIKKKC